MPRLRALVSVLASLGALPVFAQTGDDFVPVTDRMLERPDAGDWLMWRRTQNGWAYSPLEQIDKENVATLRQVWSAPMGDGGQEATPLVYAGMMYVPNRGDYVQAFDAATGQLALGVQTRAAGGRVRRHEPQHGDMGHDADRCRQRQRALRHRRAQRPARLGEQDPRAEDSRSRDLRDRSSRRAASSRAASANPTRRTKPAS